MKGIRLGYIAVVCFFLLLCQPLYGADVAKIGVIDFQRILENSSAGKYAQAEINKKGKLMEEELKRKGAEIEKRKKQLERQALVMSKEMREEKEREIRISINDFKSLQKKYMREFKEFENRLVKRIQKEIIKLVQEMGKAEGYLLIVERRSGEVIYTPKTNDITDRLIQKYNVVFSKTGGNAKKKK
ncbi:MAG: OmpH family outer membrane protein [Deltaproteobacteria bacterium]|nr:OmpH family outer membrane protein [Deltaproteobacteria bacterium]MBW2150847.1 OmpH family outer membrane protein [Deltaproteobacteria bacterium]